MLFCNLILKVGIVRGVMLADRQRKKPRKNNFEQKKGCKFAAFLVYLFVFGVNTGVNKKKDINLMFLNSCK